MASLAATAGGSAGMRTWWSGRQLTPKSGRPSTEGLRVALLREGAAEMHILKELQSP